MTTQSNSRDASSSIRRDALTSVASDTLNATPLETLNRLGAPVLAVGSLNADLVVATARLPQPGETVKGANLKILPGGKSANQAAASALAGAATTIIGAVGTDGNGDLLTESLREKGVETGCVLRRDVATGTAVILVDDQAENCIVVSAGANATLSPADIDRCEAAFREAHVLGLCFEVGYDTVLRAAHLARSNDVATVLNVSPVRSVPAELLRLVDVLIVNEHEIEAVCGYAPDLTDYEALAAVCTETGVPCIVITLGAQGSLIAHPDGVTAVPAVPVTPIDTTGAGDCFMGVLMAGIAAGATVVESAHLAAAVAAHATTRQGAQSSYAAADDIRAFIAESKTTSTS